MSTTLTHHEQLAHARRGVSQLAVSRGRATRPTTGRGTGLALGVNPYEGDNGVSAPAMWFCTIKRPAQHLTVRST